MNTENKTKNRDKNTLIGFIHYRIGKELQFASSEIRKLAYKIVSLNYNDDKILIEFVDILTAINKAIEDSVAFILNTLKPKKITDKQIKELLIKIKEIYDGTFQILYNNEGEDPTSLQKEMKHIIGQSQKSIRISLYSIITVYNYEKKNWLKIKKEELLYTTFGAFLGVIITVATIPAIKLIEKLTDWAFKLLNW